MALGTRRVQIGINGAMIGLIVQGHKSIVIDLVPEYVADTFRQAFWLTDSEIDKEKERLVNALDSLAFKLTGTALVGGTERLSAMGLAELKYAGTLVNNQAKKAFPKPSTARKW